MSRRMVRFEFHCTLGVGNLVLYCPVGYKYELVGASFATDASAQVDWYMALSTSSGLWFRDHEVTPNGFFGFYKGYEGLVFDVGDALYVIPVSSGTPAVDFVYEAIEVHPVP